MLLSWPEQLICNQLVGGSNPSIGSESRREEGERSPHSPGSGRTKASEGIRCNAESVRSGQTIWEVTRVAKWGRL